MSLYLIHLCFTLFAAFYYLLFPLAMARTLTKRFDGVLYSGQFWAPQEEYLPFYGYRRTLVYSMAIAIPWAARRKFPGFDFAPHVSPMLVNACRFQVFCAFYACVAAIAIQL